MSVLSPYVVASKVTRPLVSKNNVIVATLVSTQHKTECSCIELDN